MLTPYASADRHRRTPVRGLLAAAFALLLALMLHLPLLRTAPPALAQSEPCTVQVFYGDAGVDAGACTDMGAGMCRTREYALEQGRLLCAGEVHIFSGGLLREVYRAPTAVERRPVDWLLTGFYWLAPFLVGGLVGWWLGRIGAARASAAALAPDVAENQTDTRGLQSE